jgi:molecular chaperone GrpE
MSDPSSAAPDSNDVSAAPSGVGEPNIADALSSQIPLDTLDDPRIAELQTELAGANDQVLRALAEMENIRRRADRSVEEARIYAVDRFAKDLLQVADMLARAIAQAPAGGDERLSTFVEGVRLTEKSLLDAFAKNGLKTIGAKGEKFDPNLHQAVSQIPSDAPAGHVAEVLQAGFLLHERTLRAAMVIVSGGGGQSRPTEDTPKEPGIGVDFKV